jgi:hypothetical protein
LGTPRPPARTLRRGTLPPPPQTQHVSRLAPRLPLALPSGFPAALALGFPLASKFPSRLRERYRSRTAAATNSSRGPNCAPCGPANPFPSTPTQTRNRNFTKRTETRLAQTEPRGSSPKGCD